MVFNVLAKLWKMDKGNLSEKSDSYNYDNCIVRNHEDNSDDSASEVFSLPLPNNTDIETSPEKGATTEPEDNSELLDAPELSIKEAFTLMLGLMVKLEKYFTRNANRSAEDADFKEKIVLVRKSLMKTGKHVGYKITERKNGSFLVQNDDNNKTETESTPIESPAEEEKKDDTKTSEKTSQQGTKRKSSTVTKNQNLNPRSSKRPKVFVNCNDRLINTAAKLRCSRTREDLESVVNDLKDDALNKTKTEKKPSNKKLSKSVTFRKTAMNDRKLSRRSTSVNSLRRSLFEPVKWLEAFNRTYAPQ